METLIPVISKLQDVFATIGYRECDVQLPQIVVVGSQSAGKSSVIEGIVGRDFLPRGTGIVTRRPLLLHLIHVALDDPRRANKNKSDDWAVFEHKSGEIFVDFDLVRKEIEDETSRLSGTNKGISAIPINLRIFSHKVLNLSLIDLPGITKLPVGDQPDDIEVQIRKMITNYISNPNSLILAVTPANQDFATSEPLKLARDVDKEGKRTLAVLTKLDLMDHGTDAMDVLTGKLVSVKLGIIGVINRSQADINANKSIEECLRDEAKFLHKKYPTLASINGTQYLSKTLNRLLLHHIRECLPQLKTRLNTMAVQCRNLLRSYGEPVIDKRGTLLQIVTQFVTSYTSTIEGTSRNYIETSHLCGGARIYYIFHEMFSNNLEKMSPMEGLTLSEIMVAIRNATGPRPVIFVPEASFEMLVKRQIRRLEAPCLNCVDLVYDELLSFIQSCGVEIQQEMQRFPKLFERISEIVSTLLNSRIGPTKDFVSNLIDIELAYINSRHPEFMDTALTTLFLEPQIPNGNFNGPSSSPAASSVELDGVENGKQSQEMDIVAANHKNNSNSSAANRSGGRSGFISFKKKAKNNGVQFSMMNGSNVEQQLSNTASETGSSTENIQKSGWWFRSNSTNQSNTQLQQQQPTQKSVGEDRQAYQKVQSSPAILNSLATITTTTSSKSISQNPFENPQLKGMSARERRDCTIIEKLIRHYFLIVRKSIQDMVPKSIMKFLVNYIKENLQGELIQNLYNCDDIEELLGESDSMAQRRKESSEMLIALGKANSLICEIRETNIW